MEKIPRRRLMPSPITLFSFGLAFAVYIVFVAFVASSPPLPPQNDFVDNDVASRLVRTLYRVHDRTVDSVCVLEVDLARALASDGSIPVGTTDPEVALQDFAGPAAAQGEPGACLEGGNGSLP